jgi:AcrR family transcriptional regulator
VRTKTQEQREKILAAASRLFGSQHFHQVRMDDIAEAAEVGKGTLYRYFQDKGELYFAVLVRSAELFTQRVKDSVAEVEGLRGQLEALVTTIVAHFDEQPYLLDLIQRAEVESASKEEYPWQGARNELWQLGLDLFAEARARGEYAIRDPNLAVFMLFGGLRSVIRLGEKPRPRNLARRYIDMFLLGADEWSASEGSKARRAQAVLR